MNNNESCIHGGVSPVALLTNLHDSQAGSGRHRCPTCAYEQGFILGSTKKWKTFASFCESLKDPEPCQQGSIAPKRILLDLGGNQGGAGRHKCTNCAFKEGFQAGLLGNDIDEINLELIPKSNSDLQIKRSKIDKEKLRSDIDELDIKLVPTPSGVIPNKKSNITNPTKVDFIEKEIRNKQLGYWGELFILKNEINYLNKHGRSDLALQVIHVSSEIGDGLGYDILSFDLDGNEKKIEVKTTRGDITRPFYLTINEVNFSTENVENFYLYRLFDFDPNLNKGKYYQVKGNLKAALTLHAKLFLAYPK